MSTVWLLSVVYVLGKVLRRPMLQKGQKSLRSQLVVFVELSFQVYYGLIDLVKNEEIMSSGFIGSEKVKYGRNLMEGKGVDGESVGRQIEMGS